eukprot:EG_transcript_7767
MHVSETGAKVTLKDFDIMKMIGCGSFGKVMKVRHKGDHRFYAMKALRKDLLLQANMVKCAKEEKKILQSINHPFIVKLHYAFQTRERLYMVLDLLPGGELFEHLKKAGRFSLERTRLYAVEIASALHYLHSQGIVYRDLKLENVVLDSEGHACLTDLGLAGAPPDEDSGAAVVCGTAEYIAPEVLRGQAHGVGVDWWAYGVLVYEMLVGSPPFYSPDRQELYEFILTKPLQFPDGLHPDAVDLLGRLLERDVHARLTDGDAILSHPFFHPIDLDKALRRELVPEWVPALAAEGEGLSSSPWPADTSSAAAPDLLLAYADTV